MKTLMAVLIVTLAFLQYKLWFSATGIPQVYRLQVAVDKQMAQNTEARNLNATYEAEIHDLKNGSLAVEERARSDLGMVKKSEVFYQFLPKSGHPSDPPK